MSQHETPRTDAVVWKAGDHPWAVTADFARTLERELTAAQQRIAELEAADRDHLSAKQGMEKRLTDRIAKLERKLEESQFVHWSERDGRGEIQHYRATARAAGEMLENVATLRTQLAEARKDSARLDWLEGHQRREVYHFAYGYTAVDSENTCHDAPTLRAAIDAATDAKGAA